MKKKLHEQIEELESQGYEVDIEHYRNFDIIVDENGVETERVSPRGGVTRAVIYKGENAILYADAICSKYDNYNRKIGALIALGRAKKHLWSKNNGYGWVSDGLNAEAF